VSDVATYTLNNGSAMPQVGFGVWQVGAEETEVVVTTAIDAGYRSIDTATLYANEAAVGDAINRSEIRRDELFVTTKVWNSDQGRDATLRAYDESTRLLGLDAVDLYLIHWPIASRDLYVETWKAFEELYQQGRVGAIGVSNFTVAHLQRLLDECDVVPAVNQVELNPYLQQQELRAFHAQHDIRTEAWAPIGKGGALLDDPTVVEIARAHDADAAQVVLRWSLQHGNVVIPKSVTPSRIASNLDLFWFELSGDEMARLDELDRGVRLGPDPDLFQS
jgi:2,5-diketo-D-gluconate reductase A